METYRNLKLRSTLNIQIKFEHSSFVVRRDQDGTSLERRPSEGLRKGRQRADFGGGRGALPAVGLIQEGCQTTGYDTQIRQDCETIVEEVCQNVTVAKFNKKIEKTCTTKVRETIIIKIFKWKF